MVMKRYPNGSSRLRRHGDRWKPLLSARDRFRIEEIL
jgi:hypothetical protein